MYFEWDCEKNTDQDLAKTFFDDCSFNAKAQAIYES